MAGVNRRKLASRRDMNHRRARLRSAIVARAEQSQWSVRSSPRHQRQPLSTR